MAGGGQSSCKKQIGDMTQSLLQVPGRPLAVLFRSCSAALQQLKHAQGYKVLAERRGGKYMAALSCASRNRTPRWSLFWVSNKTTKQETGINTVYSQKPQSWLESKKKERTK